MNSYWRLHSDIEGIHIRRKGRSEGIRGDEREGEEGRVGGVVVREVKEREGEEEVEGKRGRGKGREGGKEE